MLNGIHLVNFGNHRDTRLAFGGITALVGQNGSGKTNVMRAVSQLGEIWRSGGQHGEGDMTAYTRRGSQTGILTGSVPGDFFSSLGDWGLYTRTTGGAVWLWRAHDEWSTQNCWLPDPNVDAFGERERRGRSSAESFEISSEELAALQALQRRRLGEQVPTAQIPAPIPSRDILFLDAPIGRGNWSCRYFKTNGAALVAPSYSEDATSCLNPDGSNLAWVLASLHNEHPERFNQIIDAFREVVPIVKRVRSRRAKIPRLEKRSITINKQEREFEEERSVIGEELLFDMLSGDGLPASMVSEGTLVVLAVLTLVYGGDDEANLVMLDDIELGLHPKAQRDLVSQLKNLQEKQKNLQILLSTHSPYVVDELTPEDVWLFAPDKEGCAAYARLSEHPDAKRALEVLTTGEFWSAEGEEWVLNPDRAHAKPEDAPVS